MTTAPENRFTCQRTLRLGVLVTFLHVGENNGDALFSASLVCLLKTGIGHLLQDSHENLDEALHNIRAHDRLGAICERPVDVEESTGYTWMLVEVRCSLLPSK